MLKQTSVPYIKSISKEGIDFFFSFKKTQLACSITVSGRPRAPVPDGASANISPSPRPPTSAGHSLCHQQYRPAVTIYIRDIHQKRRWGDHCVKPDWSRRSTFTPLTPAPSLQPEDRKGAWSTTKEQEWNTLRNYKQPRCWSGANKNLDQVTSFTKSFAWV